MQISASARSYRATLIPKDIELDEVEFHADHGLLPTVRVRSTSADAAMVAAHLVTGRPVLKVERVEPDFQLSPTPAWPLTPCQDMGCPRERAPA